MILSMERITKQTMSTKPRSAAWSSNHPSPPCRLAQSCAESGRFPSDHQITIDSQTKMCCYFQHYTPICPRCLQPLSDIAGDYRRVCDLRSLRGFCVPLTEEPTYQRPGTIYVPSVFDCAQCEKEKLKRMWKRLLALLRFGETGKEKVKIVAGGKSEKGSGTESGKVSRKEYDQHEECCADIYCRQKRAWRLGR